MRNYLTSELCPLDIRFSSHSNGCYTATFNYITAYTIAILCVMMGHVLCLAVTFIFALYLLCQVLDGDEEVYYANYHSSRKIGPITKEQPVGYNRRPAETRAYDREPYTRSARWRFLFHDWVRATLVLHLHDFFHEQQTFFMFNFQRFSRVRSMCCTVESGSSIFIGIIRKIKEKNCFYVRIPMRECTKWLQTKNVFMSEALNI